MATIFVSYRRDDASSQAHLISYGLAAHFGRENVFIDRDSIMIGSDFATRIGDEVGKCDALIAVIGPAWLGDQGDGAPRLHEPSDWVRLEVATALNRDILVVPVLVKGAAMPSASDLPEDLKLLAGRHGRSLLEGEHWTVLFDAMRDQLVKELERREAQTAPAPADGPVGAEPVVRAPPQPAASEPPRSAHPRLEPGSHRVGPHNGSLTVSTGTEGAAAKMGHDLVLGVNSWEATVEGGDSPSISLTADPGSVEVVGGSGGAKPLSDKDKGDIKKSVTRKVLGSSQITFKSSSVEYNGGLLAKGDLSIAGKSSSVNIPLQVGGSRVSGSITLSQNDFGIKQFSAMMGALKVTDQVTVEFEGRVPTR